MQWNQLFTPCLILFIVAPAYAGTDFSGQNTHSARFVAVAANTAPGTNGLPSPYHFQAIENASIDPQGGVALVAERNSQGSANRALWTDINGQLSLIVTEDTLLPDGEKVMFTTKDRSKRLPDDRTTFLEGNAIYSAGASGVEQIEYFGGNIAVHPSGKIAYLQDQTRLFAGDAIPGGTAEITGFSELIPSRPTINTKGSVVFESREMIEGFSTPRLVLWQNTENGLTPIITPGSIAPDTNGEIFLSYNEHPSQNDHDEVIVVASLGSRDDALYKGLPNNLELLALDGDLAPGTNGEQFTFFAEPVINNDGNGAFVGLVGSGDQIGVWSFHDGVIHDLVIEGQSSDHIVPGSTFSKLSSEQFLPFVNNRGHVVFQVEFSGPGIDNERAILVYNTLGNLLEVLKTGDVLNDLNGESFQIESMQLFTENGNGDGGNPLPSNGIDGRVTSLSDAGKLLFYAVDSNRIDGAFVIDLPAATLPEPTLIDGDFDGNCIVDGEDFLVWQRGESTIPLSKSDLSLWQSNVGTNNEIPASSTAVPEPTTQLLTLTALIPLLTRRQRR